MPRDANGAYSLPPGYLGVTGQQILASQHNGPLEDIGQALTNSLPRNGAAPMIAPLDMGGFKVTNLGDPTADSHAATKAYIDGLIATATARLVPTGTIAAFRMTSAPTGWVKENGGTIGNLSSGATTRANSDTEALFTSLWTNFDNDTLTIQASDGTDTTRGVSAAADFTANKRMPLFDSRSRYLRGADDGLAYDDELTVGLAQDDTLKSHNHTLTDPGHAHSVAFIQGTDADGTGERMQPSPSTGSYATTTSTTGITIADTGDAETRPRTSVVLFCIKL